MVIQQDLRLCPLDFLRTFLKVYHYRDGSAVPFSLIRKNGRNILKYLPDRTFRKNVLVNIFMMERRQFFVIGKQGI